jgi:hypothetical protein
LNVTLAHGLVVTPDWFVESALGSSLFPVKAQCMLSLSLYQNDLLKIFISFKQLSSYKGLCTYFLLVKNVG